MIPAIYVHESRAIPYARAVVQGYKPIETRTRDVLKSFVGHRVLVIRTAAGKPSAVVGAVTVTGKTFLSSSALDDARDLTLIPPGSKYDCRGRGKWCYYLADPEEFSDPIPLDRLNVTHKTRSFALIDMEVQKHDA